MQPRRPLRSDTKDRSTAPFPGRASRWRARVDAFHLRERWWAILDFFEASRARRVVLYVAAVGLLGTLAAWHWAYPAWQRRSAIRIAQGWLEAGQLRNAADAAQRASQLAPERPEPWAIAAELARLGGQQDQALRYSRHAAELAPDDANLTVALAAAALRAGQPAEAAAALDRLPEPWAATSAAARRIRGELARRELKLTEARDHFAEAVRLEGAVPLNEVPLATVLIQSTDPAERRRGLDLLAHWSTDRDWGIVALRTLIGDALDRGDAAGLRRWADVLRADPHFAVGDMPKWLLALHRSDPAKYAAALASLEKDHATTPAAAAQLIDWLNQIGRAEDAIRWFATLPAPAMHRAPLALLAAEALRATGRWVELEAWLAECQWDRDTEFLRWVYGLEAARRRGDEARADEFFRTLFNHGQLNTGHALFAASTLYGWGRTADAEALWWRAAEQEGSNAIEALGALARHYQVTRDAEGQYRAFRRLHLLQPDNAATANNFAFFALLTGREQRLAEQAARRNVATDPNNSYYLATLAFAHVQQGRYADALAVLRPKSAVISRSPALAFSQGLALAGLGRKEEARALLSSLPPQSLTVAEADLVSRSLAP